LVICGSRKVSFIVIEVLKKIYMENPIYLDYNATTPIDLEVAQEMSLFIKAHFGNPSSSYAPGRFNKEAINHAREQVADLINATPDEII
jgi:cysteine desulfurase